MVMYVEHGNAMGSLGTWEHESMAAWQHGKGERVEERLSSNRALSEGAPYLFSPYIRR